MQDYLCLLMAKRILLQIFYHLKYNFQSKIFVGMNYMPLQLAGRRKSGLDHLQIFHQAID